MLAHREHEWRRLIGVVVSGHGVASGRSPSPFEGGSLRYQIPLFRTLGLDLTRFYPGTINVSVAPGRLKLINPPYTFRAVKWHDAHPPEDFSFAHCRIRINGDTKRGFIYLPHPETKARDFQDPSTVEIMTDFVEHVWPGLAIKLEVDESEVRID